MNLQERADKIQQHFFGNGATVTRADFDLVLEELEKSYQEGKKEGIQETVKCFDYHDEGFGAYCDTGEDMEWGCRSNCTEHGKERARRLYKTLSPTNTV